MDGTYVGFDATIIEINLLDYAARIFLRIFGYHVPFWIAIRSIRLIETKE